MDGTAFPAWMDAGGYGGLSCAVVAAAGLAIWALVYRRGATRQAALAILLCLASAALMIFPIWWDQSRFEFFGNSLSIGEVTLVLAWTAFFGWALPLGVLISYLFLADPPTPAAQTPPRRSPHLEATLRLALADPARYDSVRRDGAPWAQLTVVNDDNLAGARPLMLRKRLTVIGREIDNDLVLNDERVSRHHAEIRVDHGVAVLLDYGSMNGTLLNQEPLTRPAPLKPGDVVDLGTRRYQFAPLDGASSAYEGDTSKIPGANGAARRQTLPPTGPPALVVTTGEAEGSRWELLEPVVVIGRDANCQIRLPDTTVSRRHAQIVRQTDGYYASDLESNNGTQVNADDLTTPRLLHDGDVLRLGTVDLRFVTLASRADGERAREPETTGENGENGEQPNNGAVSPSQTTIPLTQDVARAVALPAADENQPQQT